MTPSVCLRRVQKSRIYSSPYVVLHLDWKLELFSTAFLLISLNTGYRMERRAIEVKQAICQQIETTSLVSHLNYLYNLPFAISVPFLPYTVTVGKNHLLDIKLLSIRGNYSPKTMQECSTLPTFAN